MLGSYPELPRISRRFPLRILPGICFRNSCQKLKTYAFFQELVKKLIQEIFPCFNLSQFFFNYFPGISSRNRLVKLSLVAISYHGFHVSNNFQLFEILFCFVVTNQSSINWKRNGTDKNFFFSFRKIYQSDVTFCLVNNSMPNQTFFNDRYISYEYSKFNSIRLIESEDITVKKWPSIKIT